MLGVILVVALVVAPTQLPSLGQARTLLRRHSEGEVINAVGPISLAGFNFSREIRLHPHRSALIISTLWDSGIILFGPKGVALDAMKTDEVLRLRTADLDRDGTLELLLEERPIRGTGLQLCEFRLYTGARRWRRVWAAESRHYRDAAWTGVPVDRQSFVRLAPTSEVPHLEYRYPCGTRECVERLVLAGGALRVR